MVVNGLIGYAKYRLPVEPLLILFLVFGGDLGSEIDRLERLLDIDLSRSRNS